MVRDLRYRGVVSTIAMLVLSLRDQNMIGLVFIGHNAVNGPNLKPFNMLEGAFHVLDSLLGSLITTGSL